MATSSHAANGPRKRRLNQEGFQMQKTAREKEASKVVVKACAFIGARNTKNALTGAAKEAARSGQRKAEHELAIAVEQYEKEK